MRAPVYLLVILALSSLLAGYVAFLGLQTPLDALDRTALQNALVQVGPQAQLTLINPFWILMKGRAPQEVSLTWLLFLVLTLAAARALFIPTEHRWLRMLLGIALYTQLVGALLYVWQWLGPMPQNTSFTPMLRYFCWGAVWGFTLFRLQRLRTLRYGPEQFLEAPTSLTPYDHPDWTHRAFHYVVDSLIVWGTFLPFAGLFFSPNLIRYLAGISISEGLLTLWAVYLLARLPYYLFFEATFATTPAKLFTCSRVVTHQGQPPTFLHVLRRSLVRHIPLEAFTFFQLHQGWHDRLADTAVVHDQYPGPPPVEDLWMQGSQK